MTRDTFDDADGARAGAGQAAGRTALFDAAHAAPSRLDTAHAVAACPGAAYPDFFHREMTPTWLRAATIALGRQTPPDTEPFVWMELGCGAGMGALLTAAAHPDSRFIAVDIDPRHVAVARERAAASGVDNIDFVHADVADMARAADDAYPHCDFIVLHGVYAWVTSHTRATIRKVMQRWLKPGGLVYVAYMSHPGASGLAAAQRLLRLSAEAAAGAAASCSAASGTSSSSALPASTSPFPAARTSQVETIGAAHAGLRHGVALLRQLERSGAGYFVATPDMARQLGHLEQEDDAYLAHEFTSADWQPLHVADVMQDFAAIGCTYIGSATLIENIDAISIPARVQPMLRGVHDPATAETLRDLARNQSLRRDIYQRTDDGQDHRLAADAHRARLLNQNIAALPGAPEHGPLQLDTRIGVIEAPHAWFTPLLRALSLGPASYASIARQAPYSAQPGFLNQAFLTLFWARCAHPLPTPTTPTANIAGASADTARWQRAWQLNAWLGEQPGPRHWLLAPALATALEVPAWQAAVGHTLIGQPALRSAALASRHPDIDPATLAAFEAEVLPRWTQYGVVPDTAATAAHLPTP